MKIPLSFIQSFIEITEPAQTIGETLTLLGLELDHIQNPIPPFAKVVIGEVISVEKHPDAKNLNVAKVTDSKEIFTVVCGANNCRAGMKTAFAKVGAILTDPDGMQREIKETSIRGIQSFGMLCSASELALFDEDEGILDLPLDLKTGEDATKLLWDPVFEISLTPNLGHCMSALGIARELSAGFEIPLKPLDIPTFSGTLTKKIVIEDYALCPRYSAALIEDVTIKKSPFFIQAALYKMGQKPINSVVDTTNYLCHKFGQPMHAFDADLLEGDEIRIASLKEDLHFLCLDDVDRLVPKGTLMIFDAKKPIAIAGVMGGKNTAVSEKTKRVLLESAYFNPLAIRKAASQLGIRTESSQRFEKGTDPNQTLNMIFEAASIIRGKFIGFADLKEMSFPPRKIKYRPERINHLLGTKLSVTEIEGLLARLELNPKNNEAHIPSYRSDLKEEIDLVEEVARIYGYRNIGKNFSRVISSKTASHPMFLFENEMRQKFLSLGLNEFLTCDLISPKLQEVIQEIIPKSVKPLKTLYSKSEEFSILRASLLPGMLQVVQNNFAKKLHNISAFEIGRIHFEQNNKIVEIPMAAILLTGKLHPNHWSEKGADFDFFDLKGMLENLVQAEYIFSNHLTFHPKRQADLRVGDMMIGSLGQLHPHLLEKFDLDQEIFYAEINLELLFNLKKRHLKIHPLPQFPASERDLTVPLPIETPIQDVFDRLNQVQSALLEKIELIDLYTPEQQTQKNATFRFTYRDIAKTISFEEAEKEHAKMVDAVSNLLAK